jgi:hypothetical protein
LLRRLAQLAHGTANLHHRFALLGTGRSNFLHQLAEVFWMLGTISSSSLPARSAVVTLLPARLANFLGGLLAAFGQFAHLGSHHGKALAMLTGPRRFNGGVQGQQVGLVGNVVHDADLGGNLLHGRPPSGSPRCHLHRLLAGLGGHAVGHLGVVAVLADRRRHHVNLRCGFFTLAACSLAACDRDCAVALTWLAAPVSASAAARTSS